LLNSLNLTLILKHGEYGEFLIMPAYGRWDLIQRLKVKISTEGSESQIEGQRPTSFVV